MNIEVVEAKVLETLQSLVPKKKTVTLEKNFREELGIDSIQLVSMIALFEEELNFNSLDAISEVDLTEILTGKDIVNVIMKYQK